jgi:hypothetical protein
VVGGGSQATPSQGGQPPQNFLLIFIFLREKINFKILNLQYNKKNILR